MSTPYPFHDASIEESIIHLLDKLSQTRNLRAIKKIHAHLLRTSLLFLSDNLQTKLIFTYTKSFQENNLQTLIKFFNCSNPTNPLPFNPILSCFCRNGFPSVALKTFSFMHKNGVPIDTYSLCSSLTASSSIQDVSFGKQIHTHVVKSGWLSSVFVGSVLIDLYSKSMLIQNAADLFDEIPVKNTVCANALLSAYSDAKMWVNGLKLFRSMPRLNLNYDNWTLTEVSSTCSGLYAIDLGKQVHANIIRTVHDVGNDVFLLSSLIDMYGKCGLVQKARQVFSNAGFLERGDRKKDVVLWTSMLGVYGRNGNYEEVIGLFREMLMENVRPDGVAFVTVISACAHTGQVNLGIEYFESMTRDFGLNPSLEHYGCLVDLLCKAGELDRAWKLVDEMRCKGSVINVSVWGALLSACNDCGYVDLGKFAAQKALELDPQNVGIYVLLSNMYSRYGLWNEIGQLRELMRGRGLKKDVGCSWIEVTR